jgi:hypothetical protein
MSVKLFNPIKIFVGVKYEDKELAKSVGAKFDPNSKSWYFQYEFEEFATNADKHTFWFKPHKVVLNFDSHVSKKDSVNYFSMAVKAMDKRHNKYVLNNPKPITQKLKPIVFIDDPFVDDDDSDNLTTYTAIECKSDEINDVACSDNDSIVCVC